MKLPAFWVAGALAGGILLGKAVPILPLASAALAAAALLAGLLLLRRSRTDFRGAWIAGLAAWAALGALAAGLEGRSVPADNVARLIQAGRLDTRQPLRWRGRLRQGPSRMPFGIRYDVDLEEVEVNGRARQVSGGLRASLHHVPERDRPQPAAAEPGDRVELLLRARIPRNYLDPGAIDERAALERQGIHLTGELRDGGLLEVTGHPTPRISDRFARLRNRLLATLDALFASAPEADAVLRAMLLGDRGFLQHSIAEKFQETAVYHVLVLAGLHVGALAGFVFWLSRRLRLAPETAIAITLAVLALYVLLVEDRPPILRASLMAAIVLTAGFVYRRPSLLNTLGAAIVLILGARPSSVLDPSLQLSLAAVWAIGAFGLPVLARTTRFYAPALQHLRDATRDPGYPPRLAQLRLLLRAWAADHGWRLRRSLEPHALEILAATVRIGFVIWDLLVLSLAIQAGMLPLLALYFHRVALAGPLANVPALTLTGVIVPLGFLCLLVGSVALAAAAPLALLLRALVTALLGVVGGLAALPHLSYRIPSPPGWLLAVCAVLFAGLGACMWRGGGDAPAAREPRGARLRNVTRASLILATAALLAVVTDPFPPRIPSGRLEATVLDVGQGDSIFITFPDRRTLLIDGGGSAFAPLERLGGRPEFDVGEQVVAPYLWERGLKRLDAVAVTHTDRDHLDGLFAVLADFSVGELWVGRESPAPPLRSLEAEAEAHGVRIVHQQRGSSFEWGGVRGDFLWPNEQPSSQKASNNDSLVLRLDFSGVRCLLTADIERPTERELLTREASLRADFLKVAHHGSKTSTIPPFLAAVAPRIAAISDGADNPYGHPSPAVLDEFRGRGALLLRTDQDGAVTFSTDGRNLNVRTYLQGHPQP